jgi:hypothetical protein
VGHLSDYSPVLDISGNGQIVSREATEYYDVGLIRFCQSKKSLLSGGDEENG